MSAATFLQEPQISQTYITVGTGNLNPVHSVGPHISTKLLNLSEICSDTFQFKARQHNCLKIMDYVTNDRAVTYKRENEKSKSY